jgi:hypothetical protein
MAHSVRLRRAGLIAVALSSVFLLSACMPPREAAEDFAGLPEAEVAPVVDQGPDSGRDEAGVEADEAVDISDPDGSPYVIWWADGGQLAMVFYGSSTCPTVGEEVRVLEEAGEGNRVAIDLVQRPDDEACTMDFVPHTTLFWTPYDVTTTEPLTVEVAGYEITVPVK